MVRREICLLVGVLLLAFCLAGIIIAEHTVSGLSALWRVPADDSSYWNGFILDHLTLWLAKFAVVLGLLFGLPGVLLIRYGLCVKGKISIRHLYRRWRGDPRKMWKKNGGW